MKNAGEPGFDEVQAATRLERVDAGGAGTAFDAGPVGNGLEKGQVAWQPDAAAVAGRSQERAYHGGRLPAEAAGETIKAPMSGIFYRAPSPASPPYVREGDQVKEGQVLCVIEAMKVFNEIKAEFNCTIKKVLVENGKPLEPDQDIFQIQR